MSTAQVQAVETLPEGRSRIVWSAILLSLVVLLYGSVLKSMILQWWNDPDYGHGFFVPLFSGFIVWQQRERWLTSRSEPGDFGFVVMLGAVGLLVVGSLGAELFISRFSLLALLAGMIVFLLGWNVLRALSYPLGFLILMIPIPVIIYNQITFPLQLLASHLASSFLELVGVPVLRDGNILMLSNYSLEVVEACSGIRSLMSLTALAIAYGYLTEPRRWVRYVLVVSMVPIAIATNAIRITGAGVLAHRYGPTAAEGFLHGFSGWVIFLAALLLMFVGHRILQHMRIGQKEEVRA